MAVFNLRGNILFGIFIVLMCNVAMEMVSAQNHRFNTVSEYNHHENKSVKQTPPYTPLLYSKTGDYRGIHFFSYFALKHRLWVLVRTASLRRF